MTVLTETANTADAWTARALAHDASWERCGWTRASQSARFRTVIEAVALRPGEHLLDFGCGDGGLVDLLPADVGYVGFDWSEAMVMLGAAAHPARSFTTHWPIRAFDIVVAIGTFNLPGSKQATWHTLRHLWDTTGCRVLAVSLYAGGDDRCLVYDESEVEARLGGLSYAVALERWRPNDILAVIRR